MSRFESLANELILDIFDYLTSVEILRLFFGLNTRFNFLLQHYLQRNALDFRSAKKTDFDRICKEILPSLTEHVTRLHLSNDDDTPSQPTLFFAHGFHLDRFSSLFSLTLSSIHSLELIEEILRQCPNLISLKVIDANVESDASGAERLINQIWSLPELRYCSLENLFPVDVVFPLPHVTSTSLRFCSIQSNSISLNQFFDFARRSSQLENLQIKIKNVSSNDLVVFPIRSVKKLTLDFQDSFERLQLLLHHLPNLVDFSVELWHVFISGEQWQQILSGTQISRFQMFMNFKYPLDENPDEEIDRILRSFGSEFWLNERRWFVRCDVKSEERVTYVYTLPFAFPSFDASGIDRSKSTSSRKDPTLDDYSQVKRLICSPTLSPCPFRFPSIHHLEFSSSTSNENLSLLVPRLDRLVSLDLLSFGKSNQDELQVLLSKSRDLSTLIVDCIILSALSTKPVHHPSIRRLNLIVSDGHFYGSDCIPFIQSLVDRRCEVLLINVEQRQIVLELLEHFPHLRSLIFQSQDDRWDETDGMEQDDLIQWLTARLPSTFSVTRDDHAASAVRIWIG